MVDEINIYDDNFINLENFIKNQLNKFNEKLTAQKKFINLLFYEYNKFKQLLGNIEFLFSGVQSNLDKYEQIQLKNHKFDVLLKFFENEKEKHLNVICELHFKIINQKNELEYKIKSNESKCIIQYGNVKFQCIINDLKNTDDMIEQRKHENKILFESNNNCINQLANELNIEERNYSYLNEEFEVFKKNFDNKFEDILIYFKQIKIFKSSSSEKIIHLLISGGS